MRKGVLVGKIIKKKRSSLEKRRERKRNSLTRREDE